MSVTFKQFTSLLDEGKESYSSENYWKDDAKELGYKVKKLSGDLMKGDQTWGAFNKKDKKVGEFTEKEEGRGGWLLRESQINEIFGLFRNNEKIKADREKLKKDTAEKVAAHRAKQTKKQKNDYDDEESEKEDEESEKEDKEKKRSNSTRATRATTSAAGGRAAERDWLKHMTEVKK